MGDHVGQRRGRLAHEMGLDELVHRRQVADVDAGGSRFRFDPQLPRTYGRRDERRHERDHADAAVVGQLRQDVVGHVPRMIADGPGRGVGEDHRSRAHGQGVAHRVRRHVRQIDQHADPVHLPDDLPTELTQSTEAGLVGRRVGPVGVLVVGEGQIAHAEPVEGSQGAERVVDAVTSLGAEQTGDRAAVLSLQLQPLGRGDQGEGVRVVADHRVHGVDLLQGGRDRVRSPVGAGHEHRPELAGHPTGAKPRRGRCAARVAAGRCRGR